MVLLNSEKKELGTQAPDFKLMSVEGKKYSLSSFAQADVLAVFFICSHCPYVLAIEDRLIELARIYRDKSVQLLGVCANDPTDYPDDRPENLKKRWQAKGYGFPYLVDESQAMARAYGAVCTPDLFVYDKNRLLAYHGRLDDSWQDPTKVKTRDLQDAIDCLLEGKKPSEKQYASMGCSIKWKKG